MIPKEKANELIVKYLRIENTNDWWSIVPAKQCALIAVDEIIVELTQEISPSVHGFRHNYWTEVKQELEKL